jgi:hypothetical protein
LGRRGVRCSGRAVYVLDMSGDILVPMFSLIVMIGALGVICGDVFTTPW